MLFYYVLSEAKVVGSRVKTLIKASFVENVYDFSEAVSSSWNAFVKIKTNKVIRVSRRPLEKDCGIATACLVLINSFAFYGNLSKNEDRYRTLRR
jgi:hypothetical protein